VHNEENSKSQQHKYHIELVKNIYKLVGNLGTWKRLARLYGDKKIVIYFTVLKKINIWLRLQKNINSYQE